MARQGKPMAENIEKKNVPEIAITLPEMAASRLRRGGCQCALHSPPSGGDLIPYSSEELKYLLTTWDEAHRRQPSGLRYRNIYFGALAIILAGWLSSGTGLPFSSFLGSLLMLSGALIGVWYCLKALRH